MKVKKGKLNYDQSGRAYPDNPRLDENWDCIWEYKDKYYRLIGDNEHKEWEEVNIYNQVIDEAYKNYCKSHTSPPSNPGGPLLSDNLISVRPIQYSKEEFINKCKTDPEFSETWGLKIEERELSLEERMDLSREKRSYSWNWQNWSEEEMEWRMNNEWNIPTKLITVTRELSESEIWDYIHKNKIEILHQHAVLYGHKVGSEYRKSFIPTLKENYNIPTKETITSYE